VPHLRRAAAPPRFTTIFFGWFCTFFAASGMAALFYALGEPPAPLTPRP
jgi:hypothetical protein